MYEEENAAYLEGPEKRLEELRSRITRVEQDEIGAQQSEIERLDSMLSEEPEVITADDGSEKPNPMFRSLQEAKLEAEGRIAGARRKLSALRSSEQEVLDEVRHSPEIRQKRDEIANMQTICSRIETTIKGPRLIQMLAQALVV